MAGRSIMLVGTASNVGKSIMATGLCRIFRQDGYRVSPFKSQNMTLNTFITSDGKEIGHSQALQAAAAGVEPRVQMNPVLLKPEGEMRSQLVLMGEPVAEMSGREYREQYILRTLPAIEQALDELKQQSDIVVLEGAGSPVEINLKDRDIVNMKAAELADARVILVADIDRGGVFASIVGTLALLSPAERERIVGIIINKFRGDLSLFRDGVEWIEKHTGKPVLGVVPYLPQLQIEAEDSLALEEYGHGYRNFGELQVAVLHLPRISNFDELAVLQEEPGTELYFVSRPRHFGSPDLVIVPSSKNVDADLDYLQTSGLAERLQAYRQAGGKVLGLGSGCQLLGQELAVEQTDGTVTSSAALGLLDITTWPTAAVEYSRVLTANATRLPFEIENQQLAGQEIRTFTLELGTEALPWLQAVRRFEQPTADLVGAVSSDGGCWGTTLNGLFANNLWRRGLINWLRQEQGLPALTAPIYDQQLARDAAFDRLAAHLRQHLNMEQIYADLGLDG